jgi:hypothetical protein
MYVAVYDGTGWEKTGTDWATTEVAIHKLASTDIEYAIIVALNTGGEKRRGGLVAGYLPVSIILSRAKVMQHVHFQICA